MIDWPTVEAFIVIDLCINAALIPPAAYFGEWFLLKRLRKAGVIKPQPIKPDVDIKDLI